jgi:hypothetical protein
MLKEKQCSILKDNQMITINHKGSFKVTERFMKNAIKFNPRSVLDRYGKQGVVALSSATPEDTGLTSQSWDYAIKTTKRGYSLTWTNSNTVSGIPVVILLQYGHGTRGGAYVQGRDFINPALRPILDKLSQDISKEVSSL